MSWIGRPDRERCCDGPLGAVADTEIIARLCVRQIPNQGYQAIARKDLLPPKSGSPSNQCGNADGLSVDRASNLSGDELRRRANDRVVAAAARRTAAGKAQNQFPAAPLFAAVEKLRAIQRVDDQDQVVFVYDDPKLGNDEHAVIRVSTDVPEEELAGVLDSVESTFRR